MLVEFSTQYTREDFNDVFRYKWDHLKNDGQRGTFNEVLKENSKAPAKRHWEQTQMNTLLLSCLVNCQLQVIKRSVRLEQ